MSLATRVIVEGTVMAYDERKGKITNGARAGQDYSIRSVIIVGPLCMAEVTLADTMEVPKQGAQVRVKCEVSTYREDDQLRALEYLG